MAERFAQGGVVRGPAVPMRIERVGVGRDGMCLYSINGGTPERILTREQVRAIAKRAEPDNG